MIDSTYQVRRYIAEFSEITEKCIAEYDLSSFELELFQNEFGVSEPDNPMFECYPIKESNIDFIKNFINTEPNWDFTNKAYFIDTHAI